MKKYRFSALSIILSIVCIIAVIVVNQKIAHQYLLSDGKTRAMFGIIEMAQFYYKYYFSILGLSSLLFGLMAIRKKEMKLIIQIALILSVISNISIFIQIWKFMI
jgi:hypothetical protein